MADAEAKAPRRRAAPFITFEGIDGAGKSTHLASTLAWLQARGLTVESTREPGGTELAESLRALFLERPMDALTEALLVFAARRDHVAQKIAPALSRGHAVLCDRFTDATFAYQGAGRGFDLGVLRQLEAWVQADGQGGLIEPDLTLWFDVPPQVAAERRAAARAADRLEREDLAFFERVREGYAKRAAGAVRIVRIDAAQTVEAVGREVMNALESRLGAVTA